MKNTPLRLLFLTLLLTTGCSPAKMQFTLTHTQKLANIPSGSGLQKAGAGYYVIGDDAPFLYCLDSSFKVASKIPLLDTLPFAAGRIQKGEKPDFEAVERVGENELIIFGSGSKSPQRDLFVRILFADSPRVESHTLTPFYSHLKGLPAFRNAELNIEAATHHNSYLFLFNRKPGLIICLEYSAFLNYLKGNAPLPELHVTSFSLPKIGGVEAGFSGATVLPAESKIIFTATAEATDNAYDDGKILGSIVGLINLTNGAIANTFEYTHILTKGNPLKVESVTVEEVLAGNSAKLVFVTDDDQGNSIILKGLLHW